ncbi:MAG: SpaA isopeptide-forming pilin-related protein [Clostridia bacterium]|nr:SpaA isopeptide-forming pilin-related protein [Clostridia bacterium]
MVSKKVNKVVIIIMLFLSIINNIYASTIEEKLGSYHIYYHDDPISYVKYGNVRQKNYEYYYIDENGEEETVYCIELGLPGAEANNGYGVSVREAMNDLKISSIIANAYPYKSLEELGLETVSEARFASQFAVWTYTSNLDLSKLVANEEKYQRVVNAINKIYYTGMNSDYLVSEPVRIQKSKELAIIDSIDSNYYSQEYVVSQNSNIKSITLKSSTMGVMITDENNKEITDISTNTKFKVLVPISSIREDTNIKLVLDTKLKQNISLLGISEVTNMQNVAITLAPFSINHVDLDFNVKKVDSKIKIIKVDKEDENIKIAGVKFKISDAITGQEYGEFITDKNGEIVLDMLDIGIDQEKRLKVEEIEVPSNYYIDYDHNVKEIDVKFGQVNEVVFQNQKSRGRVKIVKTSLKDNSFSNVLGNMPLQGAKFAIYDLKGNKIEEMVTNKEGVAISQELLVGKYKIKEIEAPKYYQLNEKEIEFEIVRNGEEILINVKDDNIQIPKRLPITGC